MTKQQIAEFASQAEEMRRTLYPATAQIGADTVPCAFSRVRRDRTGLDGGYAPGRDAVAIFPEPFDLRPGVRLVIAGEAFVVASVAASRLGSGMRVEMESTAADMR